MKLPCAYLITTRDISTVYEIFQLYVENLCLGDVAKTSLSKFTRGACPMLLHQTLVIAKAVSNSISLFRQVLPEEKLLPWKMEKNAVILALARARLVGNEG